MRHLFAILALTTMLGAFAWRPVQAQYVIGVGIYDDLSVFLTYSGAWTQGILESVGYHNDTRSFTTGIGNYVEFQFWGDGFTWWNTTHENREDANVCVNTICSLVSMYSDNASSVFVRGEVTVSGLGYGTHHAQIILNSGPSMLVDAIIIHPPAPQPTLEPQEIVVELTFIPIQPTFVFEQPPTDYRHLWTVNDQVVAFDYQVSAGDVSSLLFLAVLALLTFIALLMYLMRRRGDA